MGCRQSPIPLNQEAGSAAYFEASFQHMFLEKGVFGSETARAITKLSFLASRLSMGLIGSPKGFARTTLLNHNDDNNNMMNKKSNNKNKNKNNNNSHHYLNGKTSNNSNGNNVDNNNNSQGLTRKLCGCRVCREGISGWKLKNKLYVVSVCIRMYRYTHTHTHAYTYTHTYVHIYIYIYMCV